MHSVNADSLSLSISSPGSPTHFRVPSDPSPEWGADPEAGDRVIQVIVASSAEDADLDGTESLPLPPPDRYSRTPDPRRWRPSLAVAETPDATFPVVTRLDVSAAQRVVVRERPLDEGDLDDLVDDGAAIFRRYVPFRGSLTDDDRSWSSVLEEDAGLQVGPRRDCEQSDDENVNVGAGRVAGSSAGP
jgi:hypothetical protein